jgi:anti-sigma factor RsiW
MTRHEDSTTLHAYLDGELDPVNSRALEARLAESAGLRAELERLREQSAAIRATADYHAAPAALRRRIQASLGGAARPEPVWKRWWRGAAALTASAAAAAALTLWVVRPSADAVLRDELVASHVRATLAGRPYDVASSDQHTVKPWLSARLAYSPPVEDFSLHGFPLVGARLDFVAGRRVAVLVYQRRKHVVDAFVWPQAYAPPARAASRDGINVEAATRDGMRFFLVSDLNRHELNDLARLIASAP